jgi:type I restriction enzyme S subunit
MENGLTESTLAEVCSLVTDGTHDTPKRVTSGFPLIKAKEITGGRIDFENCDQISEEEHLEVIARSKPEFGDTLFAHIGASLGEAAFVNTTREFSIKNVALFKPNPAVIDARYLYYLVISPAFQALAKGTKTGSAQPFLGLSQLRGHCIQYHRDLPTQRRIGAILSAYDELMEHSQRRIRLLESMGRAHYRECLREAGDAASAKSILKVDYWKLISANVSPYEGTKRYYATADIEKLTIEGAGIDYTFAEKPSRAQKQPTPFSVWFARMKDTYKIAWYSDVNSQSADSSVLSSGFAGFQALEPLYFPLLFLTVSSKEFHAQKDLFCTGATQMSLTNEGLSRIEVPAPSEPSARRLGEQALPLLNQMLVLQMRIQNLRRTRDLLLPRLLSGQVELL